MKYSALLILHTCTLALERCVTSARKLKLFRGLGMLRQQNTQTYWHYFMPENTNMM